MACPYYQEPPADESIGCCNGNRGKIPSESHQDCLCLSYSGIYVGFCPVYTKFQRDQLGTHRWGALKRIFLSL